jgi:hypothetical protein
MSVSCLIQVIINDLNLWSVLAREAIRQADR